ncbi:MAG: methylmalonyl Co-A mutase-associated GTPase MeaB [Anaerolineae bacterium]|nr:methylmalonyl Co-A mutase-associated GTPase MeaB [Anaerolineae bacterium]
MSGLATQILQGDRRALARLLTIVENAREGGDHALAALFPHTGHAHIIGITGPPGAGKSTLVSALTKAVRAQGKTVAILAVDPTSPFSGGAILGDRIRMRDLSGDSGVFIRSMATRGSLGGLARAARDAVRILDAAGFDYVVVETVGAGQSEVEIARMAQTVLVVEAPGMGDDVQAIKAGILEIADILVVNKADRPGLDNTIRALKLMLELGHPASRSQVSGHHGAMMSTPAPTMTSVDHALWIPVIVQTVATDGRGIDELIGAIEAHQAHLRRNGHLRELEQRQIEIELQDRLREALLTRLLENISAQDLSTLVERIQQRHMPPHEAVDMLLAGLRFEPSEE